jgi:hypothetical protein
MSIMDLFKSAPAAPANNAPASSNNNANSNTNKDLSANPPSTNADGKMPGTESTPVNPLDAYSKMFDNANSNSEIHAPSFKLDPKVIDEVAGKMNFISNISQDQINKALTGDAEAFMAVIQATSQNAYKAAIQHNTSLTDSFINQRSDFEKKQVQQGVKEQLTHQALSSAPNFNHPVIKQELNRIASQFARANPDASPVEVAEAAKQYITDLSSALNPTSSSTSNTEKEMDWSKYLSNSN